MIDCDPGTYQFPYDGRNDGRMLEELEKVNAKLSQIYDLIYPVIKRSSEYEKTDPVLIDESTGSCPNCEATNVDLQKTKGGYDIYKCLSCEMVWVNDPDAR